jgi:hypothetical protein
MGDRLGTLGAVGFPFFHNLKGYLRFLSYKVHTCFVFGFSTCKNSCKLVEIQRESIFERFRGFF